MQTLSSRISQFFCGSMFLMLISAPLAAGQDAAASPLMLAEAIQTAVSKNPAVGAASFRVEASAAQITQARSGLLPQVQFSEHYSRTTNPMYAFGAKLNQESITLQDFDPARLNDPAAIDNFASTLSLNWSLYDSGQTLYGLKQAEIGKDLSQLGLDQVRQKVIAETVKAYVGVLLAQKNLTVVTQALETARAHLNIVQKRFENGFVVKSDLLRAQTHIAELEQQRLTAESGVQVGRAYLNAAMGVPVESVFELNSPLQVGNEIEGSLQSWTETALSRRPDLKQLENREMISQAEIEKSKAAHYPSLNLMGNYEFNTGDFDQWGENYTVGAIVNINIFSGQRLSARTVEAMAALKELRARKAEMKKGIAVQIRRAYLEAQSARKRIPVAEASVGQAEEALRIIRNRYNNGLITIVALLDAELAEQNARISHFKAIHDYRVAAADLSLAAGRIDENYQ